MNAVTCRRCFEKLIPVVMKLQLHLGDLMKRFQTQLNFKMKMGEFPDVIYQSRIHEITFTLLVSAAVQKSNRKQ